MRTTRRGFVLAALGAASCSRKDSREGLRKAAQYLWSRQAEDGGWHSQAYGLLRSGQSLTPFVLDALLDTPGQPAGAVDRAIAFIKKNTNAEGALGVMDSAAVDYPNYATGLAVRALVRAKSAGWQTMVAYLRAQQFSEAGGWRRADPCYGAWGMGGVRLKAPNAGHVDLAMTRYVLEGLAACIPASDPAMQKALIYIERCQNPDGGFFFSTVNPEINKAGEHRSYGSTTADGVLALRAAGVPENDDRVVRARKWLRDHHQIDRVPGFEGPREEWSLGLRFYYAAAVTRAVPELAVLLPPQRPDGSFRNSSNLVKEDDPLIATAFAIRVGQVPDLP